LAIDRAVKKIDGDAVDVLINSAGITGESGQKTGHVDYASWAQVLDVNTMGPLRVTEAFVDNVARSERKLVVTITSGMGSIADNTSGGSIAYRSSKAAVNMVMRSAATRHGVAELLGVVADPSENRVPEVARACLAALGAQLRVLKAQILEFDRMINAWHRSSETSKRLDEIPGVGPALATALVASVADPRTFRSGCNFSAWIGLVPKQHSSGGKDRLGSISKQGDRYLRSLFVAGALAVIRYAKIHGTKHADT
jgi:NAD(P)-dependent dehydrogenase (short-subunit alcohol dehydrogenase family)